MAPPLIPNRNLRIRQTPPPDNDVNPVPSSTPTRTPKPKPTDEAAETTTGANPTSSGGRPESASASASATATAPRSRPSPPPPSRTADPASAVSASPSAEPSSSNGPFNMTQAQSGIVITIVSLIGAALVIFVAYVVLKTLRSKYKDPKYIPGSYLKNKWKNWDQIGYRSASSGGPSSLNRAARSRANIEVNRALDRQNSVRSIITLPPYREMAEMDLETTIGREGERAGVDTVVIFPETADEEEGRREDRMQAMYELRLQRRAQRAAREARTGGSTTSVNVPSATSDSLTAMDMEAGGSGRTASELTAAILNDRTRRLSEVSYSDVGYARSDGTRIRSASTNRNDAPNNQSSDSMPLLSDNASGGRRSRSGSVLSLNTNLTGGRVSTERRDSAEILTGSGENVGQTRLPPSYDGLDWGDAPPYMSPVSPVSRTNTVGSTRGRQPGLNLPLVRVIGASNPGSPMSPQDPNARDRPL